MDETYLASQESREGKAKALTSVRLNQVQRTSPFWRK